MHSELKVLIVDPVLGTGGLVELAGLLRAAVEVEPGLTCVAIFCHDLP